MRTAELGAAGEAREGLRGQQRERHTARGCPRHRRRRLRARARGSQLPGKQRSGMAEPPALHLWPGEDGAPAGGRGSGSRGGARPAARFGPGEPAPGRPRCHRLARPPTRSCLIAVAAQLISTVTTSLGRRRAAERQQLSRDFASPCLRRPGSQLGCVGRTGPQPNLAAGSHLLTKAGSFKGEPPPSARFLLRPLRRGPPDPVSPEAAGKGAAPRGWAGPCPRTGAGTPSWAF